MHTSALRLRLDQDCMLAALTVHRLCTNAATRVILNVPVLQFQKLPHRSISYSMLRTIFTSKQYRFAIAFLSLQRSRNENFIGNKLEKQKSLFFIQKDTYFKIESRIWKI